MPYLGKLTWKCISQDPHSGVSQRLCVTVGHFQSKRRARPFYGKGKARWCLSLLFFFVAYWQSFLWLFLSAGLPVFWLFLAYSWDFLRIFNWFIFISIIISSHLSVNKEKTPKDIKMRRLPGCSIRHLLPLSIKLISLLIIHVFHTLCLSVFCFQDNIFFFFFFFSLVCVCVLGFQTIRSAWRELQSICRWLYSQVIMIFLQTLPLAPVNGMKKFKSQVTCPVMQIS